jgi:hypothetical protein
VKDIEKYKQYSSLQRLLFNGANENAKDSLGRKPIELTEFIEDIEVAKEVGNILNKKKKLMEEP